MNPRPPTLDQVCEKALRLPCAPALLPQLSTALQSEDSSAQEIERLIALDASLAAATLRLANSAALGRGKAETLETAVFRLGTREIYRLAALVLVSRWETGSAEQLRWGPGDFSRHALCTAIAAEVLAEATGRIDPPAAYTAGLVCDLGKLALAHGGRDFYPAVREACAAGGCTWEQAERSVFGFHHADVGARLLGSWRFPRLFVLLAEHQLLPAAAPADAQPLLAHFLAAKHLATAMGPAGLEEGFLAAVPGAFLLEHGFTTEILEGAMPTVLEIASRRLGEQLTHGAVKL